MITKDFQLVSARHLETYIERITKATSGLTDEQTWWKPHTDTISIGTILKHLNGNVTQWIISGLGNQPDKRNREKEFTYDETPSLQTLLLNLETTVNKASDVIKSISEIEMNSEIIIQGFPVKKFEAIYHVVEHFSWHSGQITWIAKMLKGEKHGISFYDDKKLNSGK